MLKEKPQIGNEISIKKRHFKTIYKLGLKIDYFIKITDVWKVNQNKEMLNKMGILVDTNSQDEKIISFQNSKISTPIKPLMLSYLNEIQNIYKSKVGQYIGNIVISVPFHFDMNNIQFLSNHIKTEEISNLEFIYETYAAMICFNSMNTIFIKKETILRIINISDNYLEIDVIQIEEIFDNIILKTKRLTKHFIELQSDKHEEITQGIQNCFEKDKINVDHVITIGNQFTLFFVKKFLMRLFNKSSIHNVEQDVIGKGACLRAIQIQQLYQSGVEIEHDISFK